MATAAPLLAKEEKKPRWFRWTHQRRATCADGHHQPFKYRISERGAIRCSHWIAAEHRECGRWIFLIAIKGGGVLACDVTKEEIDEMDALGLDSKTAVIDYLGIFPE